MPGTAEAPEPPKSSSFASLLAGFAALTDKTKTSGEGSSSKRKSTFWNDEALEDDVAVISYEQALRTHKRTRSYGSVDQPGLPPGLPPFSPALDSPASISSYDEFSASGRKPPVSAHRASLSPASVNPTQARWESVSGTRKLRRGLLPPQPNPATLRPVTLSPKTGNQPVSPFASANPSAPRSISALQPPVSPSQLIFAPASWKRKACAPRSRKHSRSSARPPLLPQSKLRQSALKPVTSAAPHSRSWLFPRWNWMRRSLNA